MKKLCLSIAILTAVSANAQTMTTVKVALDWYINPDHAPLLVAQADGYFAKQGLNVEFIEPNNTSSARDLVLSHQADIGVDYQPETLIAISQGMPVKVFANLIPVPLSCMGVLASSSINSLSDLKGKTIAYSGDPLEADLIKTELQHNHVDPSTVKLISVNMSLTQVLMSNKVDAVNGFMRNVEPIELKQQGINTRLFYPENNDIPSYAELVLFTNANNINKATLQKFMLAVNEGEQELEAHPTIAWQKVEKAYPQDLASSKAIAQTNAIIWQASLPYFRDQMTHISTQNYQAYNQFLLSNKLIQKPILLNQYWLLLK